MAKSPFKQEFPLDFIMEVSDKLVVGKMLQLGRE